MMNVGYVGERILEKLVKHSVSRCFYFLNEMYKASTMIRMIAKISAQDEN